MLSLATLLSPRAVEFLQRVGAARDGITGNDETVRGILAREGLSEGAAFVAFERAFGGLRFTTGKDEVELGLVAMSRMGRGWHMRLSPEEKRLTIGTEGTHCTLYLDEEGRVWTYCPDCILWPRASSAAQYVEQEAMYGWRQQWCPDAFYLWVGCAIEDVMRKLDLTKDDIASDEHRMFATSGAYWATSRIKGDPLMMGWTDLWCDSLSDAAEAILKLREGANGLQICATGGEKSAKEEYLRRPANDVPDLRAVDAWAEKPGVVEISRNDEAVRTGVLWLLRDEQGRWQMQQYSWAAETGEVDEWSSFTADEQLRRYYVIAQPEQAPYVPPKHPTRDEWCGDPFILRVGSALEVVIQYLHLAHNDVASSPGEAIYSTAAHWLAVPTTDAPASAVLACNSLFSAADALHRLRKKGLAFEIEGSKQSLDTHRMDAEVHERPTLAAAEECAWDECAIRYEGLIRDGTCGIVWMGLDPQRRWQLVQYRWLVATGEIVEWSTFNASRQIRRWFSPSSEPVESPGKKALEGAKKP